MDTHLGLACESAELANLQNRERIKYLPSGITLRVFRLNEPFGDSEDLHESGEYFTLEYADNLLEEYGLRKELTKSICKIIKQLLPKKISNKKILVVGLGNSKLIADALGCEVCAGVRIGQNENAKLTALMPSVYGVTGIESQSIVKAVVQEEKPTCVIVVDTLATRKVGRLCQAVQISTEGIVPGGGVGNARKVISEESLGVTVISIGMPLVAHTHTCSELPKGYVVTPKEIDLYVPICAEIISGAINAIV